MPISDIFNSITPGRPAITEAGCDAFAVIAADRQTLDEFMSQPRELVLHFLAALATTSQAGQALVAQTLATPDIVEKLAAEDDAQAVLSLLGKLDTRPRFSPPRMSSVHSPPRRRCGPSAHSSPALMQANKLQSSPVPTR